MGDGGGDRFEMKADGGGFQLVVEGISDGGRDEFEMKAGGGGFQLVVEGISGGGGLVTKSRLVEISPRAGSIVADFVGGGAETGAVDLSHLKEVRAQTWEEEGK
ncbi:unnamed protein product [Ilex paraguariensis]|uniref:Uncharacterized protein n=1 Tax=Ilex paraguariensis TaxID=185542 RepID=A0ABC8QU70_9AQUA